MTKRRRLQTANVVLLVLLLVAQALATLPRPATAYADDPPIRVRLVPDRGDPARTPYDQQNVETWPGSFPSGGGGGGILGGLKAIRGWFADRWQDAKDLWTDLFTEGESGSLLSRVKGILIGLVKGLMDFGKGLWDLAKQLLSLLWDFLTHPARALERVKGMITGVIESIKDAFNGMRDALSEDPPDFGEGALEVGTLLGYQAIVDCVRSGLYGQAIGRGLFELVATFGPGAIAKAGGKVADIFARAGEMAGGPLSKFKSITEIKSWSMNLLRDAGGKLPFAKTKYVASRMVDEFVDPAAMKAYYADLPKHIAGSDYVASNLDKLRDLARQCAKDGNSGAACDALKGHFSNIRGEYREQRMESWIDQNVGGQSELTATHDVNTNGFDDYRQVGGKYVFGESKDVMRDGGVDSAALSRLVDPSVATPTLNVGGFTARVDLLRDQGVISPSEHTAIMQAVKNGDVEVVFFAGGTARPFIGKFGGMTQLENPLDPSHPIPVRVITDK
jgi:hypothetical protein